MKHTMLTTNDWVTLKKQSRHFDEVLKCRRIIKKATPWTDMSLFFREADKYMK